jgi:glycosyltransferase involved in cell wall biosynthesis
MKTYEVVITAFNRVAELEEAIVSILNQSVRPKEIHVVIDGVNPSIQLLCNKYDCKVYTLDHVGYPSVGRNFGISQCEADYIAFCDDDDVWLKDKMKLQLEFFAQHSDVDVLCSQAVYWDGENIFGVISRVTGHLKFFSLMLRNPCAFSSLVIKNPRKPIFDERQKLKAWEDYFMLVDHAIMGFRIYILPHVGVRYRINSSGKISIKHCFSRDKTQLRIIGSKLLNSIKWPYLIVFIPVMSLRLLRSYIHE